MLKDWVNWPPEIYAWGLWLGYTIEIWWKFKMDIERHWTWWFGKDVSLEQWLFWGGYFKFRASGCQRCAANPSIAIPLRYPWHHCCGSIRVTWHFSELRLQKLGTFASMNCNATLEKHHRFLQEVEIFEFEWNLSFKRSVCHGGWWRRWALVSTTTRFLLNYGQERAPQDLLKEKQRIIRKISYPSLPTVDGWNLAPPGMYEIL